MLLFGQQMPMRSLVVISALLLLNGVVQAQEKCAKTLAESPSVLGLKLGMSYQELSTALGPTAKVKPSKSGEGSIFLSYAEQPAPANLKDVRAMYIRMFESKAYQIEVFYQENQRDAKVEAVTAQLSQTFGLPSAAWTVKYNKAAMKCDGFSITADTILGTHIELTDNAARDAFDKKNQAEKESKKKTKS